MYAIVKTGGKQYKVAVGDVIKVEKLDADKDAEGNLDVVMIGGDGDIVCGSAVQGASVSAQVLAQDKAKKVIVYKYKAKKNERKRQGHRQPYTALKITAINA